MQAYLYLEDGDIIEGEHFGYAGPASGEVVFSTGMTGYTESLTDPSFAGQILIFTYPLIGNYGVPKPIKQAPHLMSNFESEKIWVRGVIVGSHTEKPSHYQSHQTFAEWLKQNKVPGISGVDTRALTHKIREKGCLRGKILLKKQATNVFDVDLRTVVKETSLPQVVQYQAEKEKANGKTVALVDCGVKHGIIRQLLEHGFNVVRVPWDKDPLEVAKKLRKKLDGVVVSNGPGDPKDCEPTIENIRKVLATETPFLGICLGHQLLALAIGADTYKLPYGHRGLNQPCQNVETKQAFLTSQNHGYAVNRDTIPKDFKEWFVNLNDQTSEGLRSRKGKVWSVQFHPEGRPGPFDTDWIFDLLK